MECYDPWTEVYLKKNLRIVSFVRDDARINVYYTTGTGATVSIIQFMGERSSSVLKYPRLHTGHGYWDLGGKKRVLERLLSERIFERYVVEDEKTAWEGQMRSIDEEIKQLMKHRAELAESVRLAKRQR